MYSRGFYIDQSRPDPTVSRGINQNRLEDAQRSVYDQTVRDTMF